MPSVKRKKSKRPALSWAGRREAGANRQPCVFASIVSSAISVIACAARVSAASSWPATFSAIFLDRSLRGGFLGSLVGRHRIDDLVDDGRGGCLLGILVGVDVVHDALDSRLGGRLPGEFGGVDLVDDLLDLGDRGGLLGLLGFGDRFDDFGDRLGRGGLVVVTRFGRVFEALDLAGRSRFERALVGGDGVNDGPDLVRSGSFFVQLVGTNAVDDSHRSRRPRRPLHSPRPRRRRLRWRR